LRMTTIGWQGMYLFLIFIEKKILEKERNFNVTILRTVPKKQ